MSAAAPIVATSSSCQLHDRVTAAPTPQSVAVDRSSVTSSRDRGTETVTTTRPADGRAGSNRISPYPTGRTSRHPACPRRRESPRTNMHMPSQGSREVTCLWQVDTHIGWAPQSLVIPVTVVGRTDQPGTCFLPASDYTRDKPLARRVSFFSHDRLVAWRQGLPRAVPSLVPAAQPRSPSDIAPFLGHAARSRKP